MSTIDEIIQQTDGSTSTTYTTRGSSLRPNIESLTERMEEATRRIEDVALSLCNEFDEWAKEWGYYPTSPEWLIADLVSTAIYDDLQRWGREHGTHEPGRIAHYDDAELVELARFVRTHPVGRSMLRRACTLLFCEVRDPKVLRDRITHLLAEVHRQIADDMREIGKREPEAPPSAAG